MWVPLVFSFGLYMVEALFHPNEDISRCYGLQCQNGGTPDLDLCICNCRQGYGGMLCDTEIQPSFWPVGSYSLVSTVFGCPEPEDHGWNLGYINLTLSGVTSSRHRFPERFRLLGPYHTQTFQFNFCSRIHDGVEPTENSEWPPGRYCLLKAEGKMCLNGFREGLLPLSDYSLWEEDTGGVVPDADITGQGIELTLCCRDDGSNDTIILPTAFPFYLMKPSPEVSCQAVADMVVTEEVFSFVKTSNRTWMNGEGSFVAEESENYFNVTFCYYESYERRECMYSEDKGASYRGWVNVTAYGWPCQRWDNNSHPMTQRHYDGDFDGNYCRQTWFTQNRPYCVIYDKLYECDIPVCDSTDDFPNVAMRKLYRSSPQRSDTPIANVVNGGKGKPTFVAARPMIEPWLQVDLSEDYEIHSITVYKAYDWFPYNTRRLAAYVSRKQWDFLTFGAYNCDGPYNPARTKAFRFQCRRPLTGSFVTLHNFIYYDPYYHRDNFNYFEVSEIVIRGKATGCGKSLGVRTGDVKDFQFRSSSNGQRYYAYNARLNRATGWCAHSGDPNPYIQVDLLTPMVLEGVVIQGWQEDRNDYLPHNFTIWTGMNDGTLTVYKDRMGEPKVFHLDSTFVSTVSQKFLLSVRLLTKVVRLHLYQETSPVCVKFDLIGCPKRVNMDLECGEGSTNIGLYRMLGHTFFQEPFNTSFVVPGATAGQCRTQFLANTHIYASYRYSYSDVWCTYLVGNRHSRHNQHWWLAGNSESTEYGQSVCLADAADVNQCGGVVNSTGEIRSPSYPFYYGDNMNCTWTVRLEEGSFVKLELIDLDLATKEQSYDANAYFDCEDRLTISDSHRTGSHVVAVLTGHTFETLEGPHYISSSNEISVNLIACPRIRETQARGFTIKVYATDCGGCGQGESSCSRQAVCSHQCGYISSAAFPNLYPVSASCHWRIQGRIGQYVTVTFEMIDVIAVGECEGDYVSLFDLDLAHEQTLLGKFCKHRRPIGDIQSSWQLMDVEFYSDFGTVGTGFLLKYSLRTIELSSSSVNTTGACDINWYTYDDSCYRFNTADDGLSWFEAERHCAEDGGHLVSISSLDEALFLHSTILNNYVFTEQEIYIGLRKTGRGRFEWTDGKPLSHTEWYAGDSDGTPQPDGFEREACSMMVISSIRSTDNWHDVACAFDKISQYICEKANKTAHSSVLIGGAAAVMMATYDNSNAKAGYYFPCTSGEYISALYTCDGSMDCTDGTDEDNCTSDACPPGMFTCNDGGCVDFAFYCDHKEHCKDGSDEAKCVSRECSPGQWTCGSGQCVSADQRCDLLQDCVDGSDEGNCEVCREPFFQCYDGRCLPPARVCDGFVDCGGKYREDEGSQCTTNSQPSCKAWYALGARDDGKYSIVPQGTSESFSVECAFNTTGEKITTIIHHDMEDWTVTSNTVFLEDLHYTLPEHVIAYVMSTSKSCRQYVRLDCLQAFDLIQSFAAWYDGNKARRTFVADPGSNCSCILTDVCAGDITQCACDKTRKELFLVDDNIWFTDSGYLDDMGSLPITKIWMDDTLRLGRVRHTVGPLICEERLQSTSSSLMCKNGVVVDISHKCILDYDIYQNYTGCRDLTHVEDCEKHECPADHIKCPSSYCIPIRLLCDGRPDCADGMDERGCTDFTCPGRYSCQGNKVCIPWQQVCDAVKHCPEGDDEYFCNQICPDECVCEGSHITCRMFYLDIIGQLPSYTRVLDLSETYNKTIKKNTFYHMESLAVLNLANLGVHELEEECFSGLENLLHLDLRKNFLIKLPKGVFRNMTNLHTLLLAGNDILEAYPGSFDGLSNLPSLDLSNMAFTAIVEDMFYGLSSLTFLNLSHNKLNLIEDRSFTGVRKVQTLDLTNNDITEFTGEIFSGLEELSYLHNDKHVFCCFRPHTVPEEQCLPAADEFSSCSDLMRNGALRISMWVLGFTALVGNLMVILSRCIYDRQSLKRSNDFFVANLAISDFVMGIYMIIIASADTFYRGVYSWNDEAWRSSWLCHLAGFLATLSSETSVMFLCMITADRVLVIKFPFKDFNIFKRFSKYISLSVWILGILMAGTPLLPIDYFARSFYSRSGVCLALPLTRNRPPGWEYSTTIFVIWNFICFVFIALGQAVIYQAVRASRKLRKGRTTNDMAIARKLSFIVLTDFVCWFPICVMGLMSLQGHVINSEVYAWVAVFVLPINSALNPIIYTLSSVDTMRKRKLNREKTFSSTTRSTVRTKSSVPDILRKELLFLNQPPNSVCLSTYIGSLMSAKHMLTIVHQLARSIDLLHSNGLVNGLVETDSVYVILEQGIIKKVTAACVPMATEIDEDFSKDIQDFGLLVSKMLKAYTVAKKQHLANKVNQ